MPAEKIIKGRVCINLVHALDQVVLLFLHPMSYINTSVVNIQMMLLCVFITIAHLLSHCTQKKSLFFKSMKIMYCLSCTMRKSLLGIWLLLVVYGLVHSQDFAVILWQKTKEPLSNFNLPLRAVRLYLMILHQRGLLSFHLGFLIMTDRHWISVYDINPSRWRLCEQCYGCRTFIVGYLMREADSTVLKMALKVQYPQYILQFSELHSSQIFLCIKFESRFNQQSIVLSIHQILRALWVSLVRRLLLIGYSQQYMKNAIPRLCREKR